jgi:hypothetical protein
MRGEAYGVYVLNNNFQEMENGVLHSCNIWVMWIFQNMWEVLIDLYVQKLG